MEKTEKNSEVTDDHITGYVSKMVPGMYKALKKHYADNPVMLAHFVTTIKKAAKDEEPFVSVYLMIMDAYCLGYNNAILEIDAACKEDDALSLSLKA